jgi:cysteine protease ATG4
MLLAEALVRHAHGRVLRPLPQSAACEVAALFLEAEAEAAMQPPSPPPPFALQALCAAGASHGVVAGRWLGPLGMCKALEAAAVAAGCERAVLVAPTVARRQRPSSSAAAAPPPPPPPAPPPPEPLRGLSVAVVYDPCAGGGAPALPAHRLAPLLRDDNDDEEEKAGQPRHARRGALVLVPLTLGVGRVSPLYHPQLRAVLAAPQSVGIVGGRPGASLYFIGVQGLAAGGGGGGGAADAQATDAALSSGGGGGVLLYLDPHTTRPAPSQLPRDLDSFFPPNARVAGEDKGEDGDAAASAPAAAPAVVPLPRAMPLAALDPSLALGFYLASKADLADLCARIEAIAGGGGGSGGGAGGSSGGRCPPLLTVTHGDAAGAAEGWAVRQRLRRAEQQGEAEAEVEVEAATPAGSGRKQRRRQRRKQRAAAAASAAAQEDEDEDDDWELV